MWKNELSGTASTVTGICPRERPHQNLFPARVWSAMDWCFATRTRGWLRSSGRSCLYENTIICVRSSKTVWCPAWSNRFGPRYTGNVVKSSVMVWGAFCDEHGAEDLYFFLQQNTTMHDKNFMDALKDYMHRFFELTKWHVLGRKCLRLVGRD